MCPLINQAIQNCECKNIYILCYLIVYTGVLLRNGKHVHVDFCRYFFFETFPRQLITSYTQSL